MKASFVDSVVGSTVVSAVALAVALVIVIFELSLLCSPLILVAPVGATWFIRRLSNRPLNPQPEAYALSKK
ncbi:hypothetical protein [Lysobacter capsici]|uniref:hypothetical protein n=1 Tax=Lysobacter capsici TaxID=435897 RepID=UPI001C000CC7|nr:hypothetical protein [Lysobacter capsici]QWF18181.1 hypothetical protein KME82_05285 [Lysobacter capsici]